MTEQADIESDNEGEICPSCGNFYAALVEITGWCYSCSGVAPPAFCRSCGSELKEKDHNYCSRCKYLRWLERNADNIELVMATFEVSAGRAKIIVRNDNRPICLCCGKPIKGGQKNKNFFCRKSPACKTGHNSYHYHRTARGRTHEDSLKRAIIASHKAKLLEKITQRKKVA